MKLKELPLKYAPETKKEFDPSTGERRPDYTSHWVNDASGEGVFIMPNRPDGLAKERAEHIVRCVNLHEELLTALEGAIVALKLGAHLDQRAALDYGLEILSKAKGES